MTENILKRICVRKHLEYFQSKEKRKWIPELCGKRRVYAHLASLRVIDN